MSWTQAERLSSAGGLWNDNVVCLGLSVLENFGNKKGGSDSGPTNKRLKFEMRDGVADGGCVSQT